MPIWPVIIEMRKAIAALCYEVRNIEGRNLSFNITVYSTPRQVIGRIGAVLLLLTIFLVFAAGNGYAADEAGNSNEVNLNGEVDQGQDKLWSIMLFGGLLNNGELGHVLTYHDRATNTDTGFIGAALSREVWRNSGFSVELEGGVGQQFGGHSADEATHFWGAAYLRYDKFPWDHMLHTSVAASVGLNYSTELTKFENNLSNEGDTKKLLHYFSPEIAFSLPEYRNTELVFRVHHRSSVYGVFGCTGCGSNTPTIGIRHRF